MKKALFTTIALFLCLVLNTSIHAAAVPTPSPTPSILPGFPGLGPVLPPPETLFNYANACKMVAPTVDAVHGVVLINCEVTLLDCDNLPNHLIRGLVLTDLSKPVPAPSMLAWEMTYLHPRAVMGSIFVVGTKGCTLQPPDATFYAIDYNGLGSWYNGYASQAPSAPVFVPQGGSLAIQWVTTDPYGYNENELFGVMILGTNPPTPVPTATPKP